MRVYAKNRYHNVVRKSADLLAKSERQCAENRARTKADPVRYKKKLAHAKEYKKARYANDPSVRLKSAANNAVRWALVKGLLVKLPCEHCGSTEDVQGHHPDHSKQLEVIWLCHPCHNKEHRKYKPGSHVHSPPKESSDDYEPF